jgi:hypothetical protein
MKAVVVVDFYDLSSYAEKKHDWFHNAFHAAIFKSYDAPLVDTGLIEREYLDELELEKNVFEVVEGFMDHNELNEFYWVAR